MPTKTESNESRPGAVTTPSASPDRDERRVLALQSVFRRATSGDRSIGREALRKFGAGLRGELVEE